MASGKFVTAVSTNASDILKLSVIRDLSLQYLIAFCIFMLRIIESHRRIRLTQPTIKTEGLHRPH